MRKLLSGAMVGVSPVAVATLFVAYPALIFVGVAIANPSNQNLLILLLIFIFGSGVLGLILL